MGRVYDSVEVDDVPVHTLFDSRSRRNYVTQPAARAAGLEVRTLKSTFRVGLGGERRSLGQYCNIEGTLGGFEINFFAYLVDSLGNDERGNPIDALFGANEMQLWSIGIDVEREILDLSHFTRDFIEF